MKPEQINPANNPAFSPRLYKWLRKHGTSHELHLFLRTYDEYGLFSALMIGRLNACGCHPDDFEGLSLRSVLSSERKLDLGCFAGLASSIAQAPEVEAEYLRIGRCAIDPEHKAYFIDDRWDKHVDERTCKWCGLKQRKNTTEKTVVVTTWENEQ